MPCSCLNLESCPQCSHGVTRSSDIMHCRSWQGHPFMTSFPCIAPIFAWPNYPISEKILLFLRCRITDKMQKWGNPRFLLRSCMPRAAHLFSTALTSASASFDQRRILKTAITSCPLSETKNFPVRALHIYVCRSRSRCVRRCNEQNTHAITFVFDLFNLHRWHSNIA